MNLEARLRRALAGAPPADLLLSDMREASAPEAALTAAAVLVPITDRAAPGVVLTQRLATLRRHAGQIAFPGGRIDPDDADATAAALREAEEEIALPRHIPRVIGAADRYQTGTGYQVTPIVAIVPPDLRFTPNADEVADVFEVPLDFLLDPANHREAALDLQGARRVFFEINWGARRIWGATAAMIVNLARRLA